MILIKDGDNLPTAAAAHRQQSSLAPAERVPLARGPVQRLVHRVRWASAVQLYSQEKTRVSHGTDRKNK